MRYSSRSSASLSARGYRAILFRSAVDRKLGATMRGMIIAASVIGLGMSGTVRAQEQAARGQAAPAQVADDEGGSLLLDTIFVTSANRTPTELAKTGSTVEVITNEEIDAKSFPSVIDYLTLLPGVAASQAGGMGQTAGLFIRGLPGRYIKTLYNGIDISDASSPQVQTQYEYLQTGGISRIEVLKGSQSTLYGSSAIAGVVDMSTLGERKPGVHHLIQAEGGSFGTFRGRYGFDAATEASRLAANISGLRTNGISAAAGFPERDGYRNVTLDLNGEHRFNDAFSVFASALHIDAKADFDDPGADNLFNRNFGKTTGGRGGFNLDLLDGRVKNTFSVQGVHVERDIRPSRDNYFGKRVKLDYNGSFEINKRLILQYGADHERQEAKGVRSWNPVPSAGSNHQTGFWAQGIVEPVDNLVLTAGVRRDEHSEFGGHTTYRGTGSYLIDATGTRFHASVGTGFRAPSLNELYDPDYGNTSLKPETSTSFDAGIEQALLGGTLKVGATYFRLEVKDRIDWTVAGYDQVPGDTLSQGVEASFIYAVTDWLDLGGSYTYTDSRTDSDVRSLRIPRHAVVLSATARPTEKWTISADLKYIADTIDTDFNTYPAKNVSLPDYALFNAKVAYNLNEATQVYVRGENLFDQDYQTVLGYGSPGIAGYVGIRAQF